MLSMILLVSKIFFKLKLFLSNIIIKIVLKCLNISYGSNLTCYGIPIIKFNSGAKFKIGKNCIFYSGSNLAETGINGKCRFEILDKAFLNIGNNVGMTNVTITCHNRIIISDNTLIGVGVHIYDTDFHSLNPIHRLNPVLDFANRKSRPIKIGNNVFIGAFSIILKGISIGDNSIIGAGSVVVNDIPANVVAAGNPCIVKKQIND